MRRLRHLLPVLLAAIFWVAQLQGTVHGISHVSSAAATADHLGSPHALHCDECASLAQAGAAPLLAHVVVALAPRSDATLDAQATPSLQGGPSAYYRSRAPPHASI